MAYGVVGLDVSFYQDNPDTVRQIDFVQMSKNAKFAIIRAGQNIWIDPDFSYNWIEAKKVGLLRGSYWFYDSRVEPKKQAELYASLFNGEYGELPLFADFEEKYGGVYGGFENWKIFIEHLKLITGHEIGVYTNYYYFKEFVPLGERAYFSQYPLWIAAYNNVAPLVPENWSKWEFWQFTDNGDGAFFGVESSRVDVNYFNGTLAEFESKYGGSITPPPIDENSNYGLISSRKYYDGMDYSKYKVQTSHGDIVYHVVEIETSKASFFVSPQLRSRKYVPDFLELYDLDLAINGDGFISTTIAGYAVSEGIPYGTQGIEETTYISKTNFFNDLKPSRDLIWNAISYPNRLVRDGKLANITRKDIDPRSAFGYSKDNSKFVFVAVDGKETYSVSRTGMSFEEVGNILIEHGCWVGNMLDGGGSTTLAVQDNGIKVINEPCGEDYVAKYNFNMRRVANVLGIRMKTVSIPETEIPIPEEEDPPPVTGDKMQYIIKNPVKPRKTPSMFETMTKAELPIGYTFESVGSTMVSQNISGTYYDIEFIQMPDGYYIPKYLGYTGLHYAEAVVGTPPPEVDIYMPTKVTVENQGGVYIATSFTKQ